MFVALIYYFVCFFFLRLNDERKKRKELDELYTGILQEKSWEIWGLKHKVSQYVIKSCTHFIFNIFIWAKLWNPIFPFFKYSLLHVTVILRYNQQGTSSTLNFWSVLKRAADLILLLQEHGINTKINSWTASDGL